MTDRDTVNRVERMVTTCLKSAAHGAGRIWLYSGIHFDCGGDEGSELKALVEKNRVDRGHAGGDGSEDSFTGSVCQ